MLRARFGRLPRQKSGLALPILFAVIFLLATLILAFHTFSSQRVRATGAVLNGFSALAAAEAGINCALMEMRNSQGWATHDLALVDGKFEYREPLSRTDRVADEGEFKLNRKGKGTYAGVLGSGPFQSEFKVRVGRVPLSDDPNTPAVDESSRFVRVESIGKKSDPTGKLDRYTRIVVIGEVSNFTEYVVYDGEKVILGMGSYNDSNHSNVFADGRIYGHEAVKFGNIERSGTVQKFANLDAIRSKGTIEYADSYQVTFQKPKALQGQKIDLNPNNDSSGASGLQTASGNVLDGSHGGELSIPRLQKEFYRRQAQKGGLDISARPKTKEAIPLYQGSGEHPAELIELDFGRGGFKDSGVPPDDEKALGQPYPADFNGLVYSSEPITVWGNPDQDITIFSEKDIFISGDFNIHQEHRQNYRQKFQAGDGTIVEGTPYYQYRTENAELWLESDGTLVDPKKRQRGAVGIISMGRIWFDYRHPMRFLSNELKPMIKFEIANALLADETKAYEFVRYEDASPKPAPQSIPAADVKIAGANGDDLSPTLLAYFGQGGSGTAGAALAITTGAFDPVKQAFLAAVADGDLTQKELDGTASTPGVVDAITRALLADEAQVQSHWPATPDPVLKDLTPPELGAFRAPQRLYELVYDERAAGLTSHPPHGKYSDLEGTKKEMLEDEFYMPQMSMYAMLFISAKRHDDSSEATNDNPQSMNRRFDDLGNARGKKVHYLTTFQGLEEHARGNLTNIITPLIQRFVGSEIRMALVANHLPALKTGNYWPPLRRRIYDQTLSVHPPPMIPQQVELKTWEQTGALKKEYDEF